ncbi:MAG: ATP-binding protein [Candidatus Methanoperedens sp.]|nr:ATP-binding protein [Candidatus Methanoperedens sp.]
MKKAHAFKDSEINHVKLLSILVTVFLIGYFLQKTIDGPGNLQELPGEYLEMTAQLLTVFVSLSIFSITWIASDRNTDNHSLFLGFTFLIVGFFNLFYIFSNPSMPAFFTPNSDNKAAFFLIGSRTVLATLFLASVYIYKETSPKLINKFVLMLFSLAISVISMTFAIIYKDSLFMIYDFSGFSRSSFYFIIIAAVISLAGYLYAKRIKKTGEKDQIFLIYGIVIVFVSSVVFLFFEYSGSFLMVTGYYFIYFGLYRSSVELPYERLARAEERLYQAAQENYNNLIENANDAIIATDLENTITGWNKAAEKLFGWTAPEVSGKIYSKILVPDNLIEDRYKNNKNPLGEISSPTMETIRLRKDGTKIDVSLTISPILNEDKKVIGLFDIIRDITQHIQAEEKLKKANIELKKADELKSQFLSVVSHEMRTPITPINAQLQLMLTEYLGKITDKQKNSLEMIKRNTERLDRFIGEVLDISKFEAGVMKFEFAPENMNKIVGNAVEIMKIQALNKNLELLFKEDKVPEVVIDKDRITQVIMDLINNAIKFTDTGGVIEVELSGDIDHAIVKVKDNGIGIKNEDMEMLFRPFQQLDSSYGRKYGGSGLGLAICKRIISFHGGKIWAQSEFGKGSTFQFRIPYTHKVKDEKNGSILFEESIKET